MAEYKKIKAYAGQRALEILLRSARASIIGAFSKGLYFAVEDTGDIIAMYGEGYGVIPFGICISDMSALCMGETKPAVGDGVIIKDTAFIFENARIEITTEPFSDNLFPTESLRLTPALIDERVKIAANYFIGEKSGGDLSALFSKEITTDNADEAYYKKLITRINDLDFAIINASADTEKHVCGLLGLGAGLTPSGDDFLTGLMSALSFHGRAPFTFALLSECVQKNAPSHTSRISVAYLRSAATGERFSLIDNLCASLLYGTPQIEPALNNLLQIGSHSGGDLLAGILIGFTRGYE